MALISSQQYAHVRLTVTDIERSVSFYDQVFGWDKAIDMRQHIDDDGVAQAPEKFYGGVIYAMPQGTLLGLRPVGAESFDPGVTGLDHVSFTVESRRALDDAVAAFDDAGIAHGEVIEFTDAGMAVLSFQDPDDINLELTAPLG